MLTALTPPLIVASGHGLPGAIQTIQSNGRRTVLSAELRVRVQQGLLPAALGVLIGFWSRSNMSVATAVAVRHPLEPLSADEVQQAVDLLKAAGKVTPTMRFVSVSLKEPK